MTTSSAGPSLGLVVLTLTSLGAGFLAANVPAEEPMHPIGQIASVDHAYGVDLGAGEQLALSLDEAAPADASLAVYDPRDRFVEHVELSAGEQTVLTASRAGVWVLVPTSAPPSNLTVALPEDQTQIPQRPLHELELRTVEHPLTSSNGSSVEVRESTTVDRLPARTYLSVDGTAEGLDATVRTPVGPVFEVESATVNGSTARLSERAGTAADPGNLVTGTYLVRASASSLQGDLTLVYTTYERPDHERPPVETAMQGLSEKGVVVAAIGEGEAVSVDAQRARELRLATARETSAKALVYEGDDVETIARVGGTQGYEWDWTNSSKPAFRTSTLPVNGTSSYVLYADSIRGRGDTLYVLLPGLRTAEGGRELDIVRSSVALEGGTVSSQGHKQVDVVLEGGLVAIETDVDDVYSSSYEIRVDGPEGVVYEEVSRNSVAGRPASTSGRVSTAHFGDGTYTVILDSDESLDGDMRVTLHAYQR